jgi:hypothetical protein
VSLQDCVAIASVENVDTSLVAPVPAISGVTLTQGAAKIPALQASWVVPTDHIITGLQFQYQDTNLGAIATTSAVQSIAQGLWQATDGVVAAKTYTVWYRAVAGDRFGPWIQYFPNITAPAAFTSNDTGMVGGIPSSTVIASLPGLDTVPPGAPSGLAGTAAFQTIFLTWNNPADADLKSTEIWENTVDNRGTASRIATADAVHSAPGGFARPGLSTGVSRYYWVRCVDTSGNVGPFNGTAGTLVTTASLSIPDFPSSIKPVGRGSSLPTASTYDGDTFYLTTDQKLYRKNSTNTGWIVTTQTTDLNGQITTSQITAGAITTALIAAGAITATQIAANTITASQIAAASISADRLSVASLSAISANIGTVTAGIIQNAGGTTFFDLSNSRAQFAVGSYVSRMGALGTGVLRWFGPSSVAIGSETRTNGVFAEGDDGNVYYGSSVLSTGGGGTLTVTMSGGMANASAITTNPTTKTSSTATASVSGGTAPYNYGWSIVSYDGLNACALTNPSTSGSSSTSNSCAATTQVSFGESSTLFARCTVIDANGKIGFADCTGGFTDTAH